MSQAGIIKVKDNILPPDVPELFPTDVHSPAIPFNHILNIFGGQVTTNNTLGIQTDGSSGGDTVTVQLTNRISGTGTTSDGVTPVTLYTFPLGGTDGTYLFTARLVAFNITDGLSAAYAAQACVKTLGGISTLISSSNSLTSEEGTMSNLIIVNNTSGNNLVLVVVGLVGKTIHYRALTEYIFVS